MSQQSRIRGKTLCTAASLLALAAFFLAGCASLQAPTPGLSPTPSPTSLAPSSPTLAPTAQSTPTPSVAPSATPVAPAPSGLIAYVGPDDQLWLMQADGSDRQALTTGETVVSPAWSPDGGMLAYVSRQGPSGQAFLYSLSSRQAQPIGPVVDFNPHTLNWSADGLYLLVDSGTSVISTATILEVPTGQVAQQLQVEMYAWSPEGHRLAFGREHPLATPLPIGAGNSIDLVVLDVEQGTELVVFEGSATMLYTPKAWLPDGRLLYDRLDWDPATQTGQDSLWTVTVDDTVGVPQPAADVPPQFDPAAVLARLPADLRDSVTGFFSWSPDARWVLFQVQEGNQTAIYRFDWINGGPPVRLVDGSSAVWQPMPSLPPALSSATATPTPIASPSPPATPTTAANLAPETASSLSWRRILFSYNHEGTELWTVDPATGEAQKQIRPGQIIQHPALSPSGETIAYVYVTGDYGGVPGELWLMDSEGANPRSLYVPPPGHGVLSQVTWQPDGEAIYFLQSGSASFQLLRLPSAGGEPTAILTDCLDFSLSPGGESLVAMTLRRQLGVFAPDGHKLRTLVPEDTSFGDYGSPAFSPDGHLLAFRGTEEGGQDTWNLYVMNADGTNVRRLTYLTGFSPFLSTSGQINGLAWTADGTHLVYSVDGHPTQIGIWRIGLDGGPPQRLFAWQEGEWAAVMGPWIEPASATLPSDADVQSLLDDYSQALSSGEIPHPAFYSPAMQDLLADRRAFYQEFSRVATHSNLLGIDSRYTIESVVPDAVEEDLVHIRAWEVLTETARYRKPTPEEYTPTRAALWALDRTDDPAVQAALQNYIDTELSRYSSRLNIGSSYETIWILRHHLLIRTEDAGLILVQDTYDDKANDNGDGTDVVDWVDGQFVRHKPDLTSWPDYAMYHEPLEKVEKLGQRLLEDYGRRYGATPTPGAGPN